MANGYRVSDGSLVRWLNESGPYLEIYRGAGQWEQWSDPYEWLYGTPIDGERLQQYMQSIDARVRGRAAESIARLVNGLTSPDSGVPPGKTAGENF